MTGTEHTDLISRRLAEAREGLRRYRPEEAADAVGTGALLVDLRPLEYRLRFGEIPGAVAVSRHVLEWRLDVTGQARLKELGPGQSDREIILLCNEGYTSSLAARQVADLLGLTAVGDVLGGFAAWSAAGLPVTPRLTA
ncbi:sulfurtransferase [Amycolatopsis antarctica]|uniref:Sulfurtransferase n=1 Tax=Amycolatopsis antarctica TaxID=1854586 RepID=A0A263D4H1_9PSEU|nr:rhodanese-like domain-containing protein [Amycolatopsis antarctica]OZM73089.1 sulfurtransferase [Amycolatopsis antarctica]